MELFWKFAAGHANGKLFENLMESLHAAFFRQQSWDVSRWFLFAYQCLCEAVQQPHVTDQSQEDKVNHVQQALVTEQSEFEKVRHAETAAAAVLPVKVDLRGTMIRVAEVRALSLALEHVLHVVNLDLASCRLQAEHF